MIAWVEGVLAGDRRSLARLLTAVENRAPGSDAALAALYPHTGRAWIIGVTGAPGTGKSTLVNELAKAYRAAGQQVGILAVDPTSPFSGGALLGDRIRMRDLSGDKGVFIRSMATRGSLGGLARASRDAVRVLDAGGFEVILIETVGAGQSEVDIVRTAHTTLVVEAPGLGDEVQAIKAGILEIADILVINKADRPGCAQTHRALRSMLELGHPASREQYVSHHGQRMQVEMPTVNPVATLWIPPIIETVASKPSGIDALHDAIAAHRAHVNANGLFGRLERANLEIELIDRLRDALLRRWLGQITPDDLDALIAGVQARTIAPQAAIDHLLTLGTPGD